MQQTGIDIQMPQPVSARGDAGLQIGTRAWIQHGFRRVDGLRNYDSAAPLRAPPLPLLPGARRRQQGVLDDAIELEVALHQRIDFVEAKRVVTQQYNDHAQRRSPA